VLQVYRDNLPAMHLYTDLGFQEVAGEMGLRLAAVGSVAVLDAPGYELRPYQPAQEYGQLAYELAGLAIPRHSSGSSGYELGSMSRTG